jgi:hypothetical protein
MSFWLMSSSLLGYVIVLLISAVWFMWEEGGYRFGGPSGKVCVGVCRRECVCRCVSVCKCV